MAFDYFYTFENFIGYTGDLAGSPTLYFMNEAFYGRITTQHPHADNVGRAAPRSLNGYTFQNCWVKRVPIGGKMRYRPCQAGDQGAVWRLFESNTRLGSTHTSRNVLVQCLAPDVRAQVKARVLYLISENTEAKGKDDRSDW